MQCRRYAGAATPRTLRFYRQRLQAMQFEVVPFILRFFGALAHWRHNHESLLLPTREGASL